MIIVKTIETVKKISKKYPFKTSSYLHKVSYNYVGKYKKVIMFTVLIDKSRRWKIKDSLYCLVFIFFPFSIKSINKANTKFFAAIFVGVFVLGLIGLIINLTS